MARVETILDTPNMDTEYLTQLVKPKVECPSIAHTQVPTSTTVSIQVKPLPTIGLLGNIAMPLMYTVQPETTMSKRQV